MRVKITRDVLNKASEDDATVEEFLKTRGNNYTGLTAHNRYVVGSIGEWSLAKLFDRFSIRYEYDGFKQGYEVGKEDFTIYWDGKPVTIDVKTASSPNYIKMMLPKAQVDRYRHDIYVGIRLNGEYAEVHGYCWHDELEPVIIPKPKIPTVGKSLDELTPIDNILLNADRGVLI